ncbi:MAG TPA: class D sortase [Anaerolineales bacterium]|nr:class D sortase [Anaerolineales bacterium]
MRKKASAEDLSVEELHRLLVEKRRVARQERLEHFRKTGRVIVVASDLERPALEDLRTGRLPESGEAEPALEPRRRGRDFLDGLLLSVEVLAIAGLLFVLFNGANLMRQLNREVASALVQPTLTPTPLIVAVVLPSGHTPPTSPGGARPNDAEIPEHLRPLVQSLANIPVPTPGLEQAIRVQIPAIEVDAPVVQGDGWEQLKKGVGQHIGTSNPGEKGNLVLSAHNDVFGEIFRDLDRLKSGDQVIVYTNQRAYTYVISASQIVEPTEVEVMAATKEPSLTLISCYPYLVDNKRIVITAQLNSGSN